MNRTLTDFLNHALLPFVGRARELQRLVAFWRGFSEASGLRVGRLIGEAGVGKSRLLEEFVPHVGRDGGLAVQIKLHPESTASIASLLARALWYSDFGPYLLKPEPEETLPSVIAALRRLARLRPTLVVIEDIHLLSSASVAELATLLEALADEVVTVVAVARPVELPARALMQRFLVEEIVLEGLDLSTIGVLWSRLFDAPPEGEILEALGLVTAGNALALRSSLRSALASGAITLTGNGDLRSVSDTAFTAALRQDVDLVSRGMAAHLTAEERTAAATLASLGELFSRDAAELILDNANRSIDILLFKGILAPAQASPLWGTESGSRSLRFTHTLVHRSFVDAAEIDPARLVRLFTTSVALYTILPIELLERYPLAGILTNDELEKLLETLPSIAWKLNAGPDWEHGLAVWEIYKRIHASVGHRLESTTRRRNELVILERDLSFYRAEVYTERYRERIDEALAVTGDPTTTEQAAFRLGICYYLLDRTVTLSELEKARQIIEEADRIVERFPDVRFTRSWVLILSARAKGAMMTRNRQMLRAVDRAVGEMYRLGEVDPALQKSLGSHVAPYLLLLFDSEHELERRREELVALISAPGSSHSFLEALRVEFLYEQGKIHSLLEVAEGAIARAKADGLPPNTTVVQLHRLPGRLAAGIPPCDLRDEAMAVAGTMAVTFRDRFGWLLWEKLATVGWLLGESEWVMQRYDEMVHGEFREMISLELRVMMSLSNGEPIEVPAGSNESGNVMPEFDRLLLDLQQSRTSTDSIVERSERILALPLLRFSDLLRQRAVIRLIETSSIGDTIGPLLHETIAGALRRALQWLEVRQLPALMRPIPSDFPGYLSARESKEWSARIVELQQTIDTRQHADSNTELLRLSMLGAIEARLPNGEVWRPRGARIRILLGLLVANQMLDRPLDHPEFCAIASGVQADHEQARKATNVVIFRLRESLGHDAIDTTESVPRLDGARLRVDLLEAHRHLEDATLSLRNGVLSRAVPALLGAMEILNGDVPFPSLYEDFFEAAREDFEKRYRMTVIRIARSLLREGDAANAETILGRALASMPEDQELAEILCESLVLLGRRTEAERIRMRSAGAI